MDNSKNIHDRFLFSLIEQGNKDAFNVLFRYYYSGLVVFAMRYVGKQEVAEELVQDVFFKLWSEREHIHIHTSVRDFLFSSVRNKCLDHLKHRKVVGKYIQSEKDQPKKTENYDLFIEQELREIIKDTIDKLPRECRKVFVLSRIRNNTNKEIAAKLGISVKTVENQISKALKIFREVLKDYL